MEKYYYIDKNNIQQGPVYKEQLTGFGVTGNTPVWKRGMADWLPASSIPELSGLVPPGLPIAPVSPPPMQDRSPGEVIYSGDANHFVNIEAVGGQLFLTTRQLVFISHGLNFQDHKLYIDLNRIRDITFYNTLGIFTNGMNVILENGMPEKFVLWKRNIWKEEIFRQIEKNKMQK